MSSDSEGEYEGLGPQPKRQKRHKYKKFAERVASVSLMHAAPTCTQ